MDHGTVQARIQRLFDLPDRTAEGEFRTRTAAGTDRVWDFSSAPLGRLEDGRRVVLSMALDVTERRAAEDELRELNASLEQRVMARVADLQAANEELKAFSYSVAHDLRTSLRSISGFAEILQRRQGDALDDDGRHCLANVVGAAHEMETLLEDLLRYATLGAGAVHREPVPIGPIVDRLRVSFAGRIAATGARLDVIEPLAVPLGDPVLVERILANLLDNALTYAGPGKEPAVTVRSTLVDEQVRLEVEDHGIGIEPQYLERIFDVFARLHAADEYSGTGIGLAIVRKAARLMGADPLVTSVPGRGSTFSVVLPTAVGGRHDAGDIR